MCCALVLYLILPITIIVCGTFLNKLEDNKPLLSL